MLTKLTPEQVSRYWDIIRYAVDQSVPPIAGEHPGKMNNILTACLTGRMDVWCSYTLGDDIRKFEAVLLTELLHDVPSGTKNLLIYCLYGYSSISDDSWKDGIVALLKYAKSKGCNQIVAYTDNQRVVEVVSDLGGEAKFTFLSFNVNKLLKGI